MINQGARTRAMNVEKDFSIALQGQRDQREALNRAQDETRKDQLEYDAFSKEIADQMGQFGKLDMLENDVAAIRGVEKNARSQVAELLRKHGGDVRAFMRAGGGRGALANYASKIKNSKEYGNGVFNAQTFELINKAVEKGEIPNYVDIGTPDMPNLIPMQEAVKLKAMGKIDTVSWNGSFKAMQISDIADMTRNIVNQSANPREATPNEVRAMFRSKNLPDWYVEQQVTQYEKEFFGKGGAKNPLWIDGNQGLRQIRENDKNRAANAAELDKRLAAKPQGVSPRALVLESPMGWTDFNGGQKAVYNAEPKASNIQYKRFHDVKNDPITATGMQVGYRPEDAIVISKDGKLRAINLNGNKTPKSQLPGGIGGDELLRARVMENAFDTTEQYPDEANTIKSFTGEIMKVDLPPSKGGPVYYTKAIIHTYPGHIKAQWFKHTGRSTAFGNSDTKEEYEVWLPMKATAADELAQVDQVAALGSQPTYSQQQAQN